MSKINVLSLFDGMGCLGIALKELGYELDYYSSEIDKSAISVSKLNFPDSIQLGDVVLLRKAMTWSDEISDRFKKSPYISKYHKAKFTKLRSIDWGKIDIIGAGSPCQGFSFSGKQLAFDDPRSKLFFEFVKILEHIRKLNPNVLYLLENVKMEKIHEDVISNILKIEPLEINANLVSAQNRLRLYWTNIHSESYGLFGDYRKSLIHPPKDRNLRLRDIEDKNVDQKYYVKPDRLNQIIKSHHNKVPAIHGRIINAKEISTHQGDKLFYPENRMQCLTAQGGNLLRGIGYSDGYTIRKLTPNECCKLQCIPDWYQWGDATDAKIYKMLGNGWNVDIVKHILSHMNRL